LPIKASPGKKLARPHLDKQAECGGARLSPQLHGKRKQEDVVSGQLRQKNSRPYLKNNYSKKGSGHGSSGKSPA
jgi:hypothetical protein